MNVLLYLLFSIFLITIIQARPAEDKAKPPIVETSEKKNVEPVAVSMPSSISKVDKGSAEPVTTGGKSLQLDNVDKEKVVKPVPVEKPVDKVGKEISSAPIVEEEKVDKKLREATENKDVKKDEKKNDSKHEVKAEKYTFKKPKTLTPKPKKSDAGLPVGGLPDPAEALPGATGGLPGPVGELPIPSTKDLPIPGGLPGPAGALSGAEEGSPGPAGGLPVPVPSTKDLPIPKLPLVGLPV